MFHTSFLRSELLECSIITLRLNSFYLSKCCRQGKGLGTFRCSVSLEELLASKPISEGPFSPHLVDADPVGAPRSSMPFISRAPSSRQQPTKIWVNQFPIPHARDFPTDKKLIFLEKGTCTSKCQFSIYFKMFQSKNILPLVILNSIFGLTQSAQTGCSTSVTTGFESITSAVTINTSPLDPFETVKLSATNDWQYHW